MKATKPRLILFALFSPACIMFSGGCSTTDAVTGERVRNMYTIQEDISMGQAVYSDIYNQMKKQGVPINADKKNSGMIQEMVKRIAAVSHIPDLPYQVALFETNIVNAAAAPGGNIVVFSGLYDPKIGLARNENEIAAVIAHEVAHVTCRHTTESLTSRLPTDLLLLGLSIYAEANEEDELALALGVAFIAYEGFYLPRYSRSNEAEADAVGLMYMAKAGYDPRAAPQLWKRVYEKEGKASPFSNWMSSHPSHEDRYRSLEKMLPEAIAVYEKTKPAYP